MTSEVPLTPSKGADIIVGEVHHQLIPAQDLSIGRNRGGEGKVALRGAGAGELVGAHHGVNKALSIAIGQFEAQLDMRSLCNPLARSLGDTILIAALRHPPSVAC